MPNSEISECTDCIEPFCLTCDFEFGRCPDCGGRLCQECAASALEERRGRCLSCDDPELATVQFPYPEGRKIYRHYTAPKKGKLD